MGSFKRQMFNMFGKKVNIMQNIQKILTLHYSGYIQCLQGRLNVDNVPLGSEFI